MCKGLPGLEPSDRIWGGWPNLDDVDQYFTCVLGSADNDLAGAGVMPVGRKWRARATVDGKYTHLGYFTNERDAAKAYRHFIQKVDGSINHPEWAELD